MRNRSNYKYLFAILPMFWLHSCTKNIDYQKMYEVSHHVESYTETYHEAELRFGEWSIGERLYGYPVETITFNREGIPLQILIESEWNISSFRYENVIENKLIVGFSTYNDDNEEIERAKYNNKSISGWNINVINSSGDTIRSSKIELENGRNKKVIYKNYENDFFQENLFHYKDGYTSQIDISSGSVENELNSDPNILRYEYLEFDEFGNWKRRLVFRGDSKEPLHIMVRKFEYF